MRARILGPAVVLALGLAFAPPAAAAPRVTFFFGLPRPEARAQAAFFAVSSPGSRSYRRFASPRAVGGLWGASPSVRAAFVRAARRHGLSARIDPSGVFARVSGTTTRFERVLHVPVIREFFNDPNLYSYFTRRPPRLPADLRRLTREVVPSFARSAGNGPRRAQAARAPKRTGTWTRGCAQAKATGGFAYEQLRHAYGIDRLGDGAGATVAILNVAEGVSREELAENRRCFGYPHARVRYLRTDGQASPFTQGLFEPEEDLAMVRGIAPRLRGIDFTQVWGTSELYFLGAAQVFSARPLADTLSISYGLCERGIRGAGSTVTSRAGADLLDAMLVRLGLAGVGSYASAGDSGSTCNGAPLPGAAWPGTSPFLTSVGGTRVTLTRGNGRASEVVWNDRPFDPQGGAGGGGLSFVSPRPPYQRALRVAGRTRAVPDVSANASAYPGYPIVEGRSWITDAGTSAASPLVAAGMAVLDAQQRRLGLPRVGPANGLFYATARRGTLHDITRGDNGIVRSVPGHRARRGYDLASGLGVPRFGWLLR